MSTDDLFIKDLPSAGVTHSPSAPPTELERRERRRSSRTSNGSMASLRAAPLVPQHKHIWVITGPAGCGKTSVAEYLHQAFSLPYLEGDTFHTPENVKKMAEGHPLTDADRWDWLILLREQSLQALHSSETPGVIVTCSALKKKYRDVIRIATYHDPTVLVHFVFLNASESLLMDRVRGRQGHYMKDYMVHSQFESLEAPQADETDVLSVEASGTSVEVQKLALAVVKKVMEKDAGVA
ncbi:hypothetical protein LTR85_005747 [Meristemomyces frigidus]|nr:hypothetical protein LTR85_005747 [Meristemomyces frigidus]